ncbi:MAG: alpha/beta hydrolase, partial [Rhodoferax sp.]
RNTHRVKAALLVAPSDVEQEALRPVLASWSPVPLHPLPFKSSLVASRDDPFCSFARAQVFAAAWGSTRVDAGAAGHVNADSGLGAWPWGQDVLNELIHN